MSLFDNYAEEHGDTTSVVQPVNPSVTLHVHPDNLPTLEAKLAELAVETDENGDEAWPRLIQRSAEEGKVNNTLYFGNYLEKSGEKIGEVIVYTQKRGKPYHSVVLKGELMELSF